MKAYKNIQNIYDSLINLENYVKALSSRGPTSLSTYLENFTAQLMEVFYGYKFFNLNYHQHNVAGIDLLDESQKHGVQVTIERNNANKVIHSIDKSKEFHRLTVFFFDHNKTDTVVKNVKQKGHSLSNIEVISLKNIFDDAENNPTKAAKYYALCKLWIEGYSNFDIDIVEIINKEMLKKVEGNKLSKKYIPEIYTPEIGLRNRCRQFADPTLAKQLLFCEAGKLYQGSSFNYLKDKTAKLKDGTVLTIKNDCDATAELNSPITDTTTSSLVCKLRNYSEMSKGANYGIAYFNNEGKKIEFDECYSNLNCGVQFTIDKLLSSYTLSEKQYFFIVKDAGQGKTNFLCDFCSNVLLKRNIPVIYINVNELTKTLLDTLKEQLQMWFQKDLFEVLDLLKQYFSNINRNVIIVIDGLNEKNNLVAFRSEVLELFRFVDNYPLFKIIATSRNVAYNAFYKSFENESFGVMIHSEIELNNNRHQRKDKSFQRRLYQKYKNYFNYTCFVSRIAKEKLTNDTLLLRIFSEVYQNNSTAIVNDIFLYKLFSEYINKRAIQMEQSGRIRRSDDLINLLLKIAKIMIQSRQLNYFSNTDFSTEEKDLLDIIVNEDILIKTYENDAKMLLLPKTNYSFTYDEFRDFLIAYTYVDADDLTFSKEVHYMALNKGRFDGVLKYLFLIFRGCKNSKLSILEKEEVYWDIYSENLFSLEDELLTEADVEIVENAFNQNNEWLFYNICNRINTYHFKNLSILNLVNYRVNNYMESNWTWTELFIQTNYEGKEIGILPELLQDKLGDTAKEEVFGILAFLSTFDYWTCEIEEQFIKRLYKDFPVAFNSSIDNLEILYPTLLSKIDLIKEAVK